MVFKEQHPHIPTKSGLMMGMGEENEEMQKVLDDLRAHNVNMLTLGQYLQPSKHHFPVKRYVPPIEFDALGDYAKKIGFSQAACGPMVRSSYHADKQAAGVEVR
jgi:lipoic acid synthetase